MRYELDSKGYICKLFFGCLSGTCKQYEGTVPEGYETLEAWAENANIRAYKIVNSNLVYDKARDEALQKEWGTEWEKYRPPTIEELNIKLEETKTETKESIDLLEQEVIGGYATKDEAEILADKINKSDASMKEQRKKITATGELITIDGATTLPPEVLITNINYYKYNKIKLIATNKNMLPNTASNMTVGGVQFAVNIDKSISINGTATEDIEYTLAGAENNTSPVIVFKKNTEYYLTSNKTLKMYFYDGTTNTEVFSGASGNVLFDKDTQVTHIVVCIEAGTTVDSKLRPQIDLGGEASEYVAHEEYSLDIDFSKYVEEGLFPSDTLYPSKTLYPKGTVIGYIEVKDNEIVIEKDYQELLIRNGSLTMPDDCKYIYATENAALKVTCWTNVLEVDDLDFMRGKSTSTNKFRVLSDGSIEAHNGYFSGDIHLEDGGKVIGGDGLLTVLQFNPIDETNKEFMGFFPEGLYNEVLKTRHIFNVTIPKDFTIVNARVVITHSPVKWCASETDQFWGYARNLNLYYAASLNFIRKADTYGTFKDSLENCLLVNTNAINYTAKEPTDSSYATETVESYDFKGVLNANKTKDTHHLLVLQTSKAPPAFKNDLIERESWSQTGQGNAVIYVTGYTKI